MNDWKKQYEERQKAYGEECLKELKEKGFDTEGVTLEQAVTIMIPYHAPENFYCDGEINHAQAMIRWKQQLANSGLSQKKISEATKMMR